MDHRFSAFTVALMLTLALLIASTTSAQAYTYVEGFTWQHLPGDEVVDISVGANGDIWMVGGGYAEGVGYLLHKWDPASEQWVTHGVGRGVRIDVAPDGTPYIITEDGFLHHRQADGTWVALPFQNVHDVAIGPQGEVWVVAENSDSIPGPEVYRQEGQGWGYKSWAGLRLDVHPDGTVYVVGNDGTLWRSNGGPWTQMLGESFHDISIGAGGHMWATVWILDVGGGGWEGITVDVEYLIVGWNSSEFKWERGGTGQGKSIAVDPNGQVWVVADDGTVWQGVPPVQMPDALQPTGDATVAATVAFLEDLGFGTHLRFKAVSDRPDLDFKPYSHWPEYGAWIPVGGQVAIDVYINDDNCMLELFADVDFGIRVEESLGGRIGRETIGDDDRMFLRGIRSERKKFPQGVAANLKFETYGHTPPPPFGEFTLFDGEGLAPYNDEISSIRWSGGCQGATIELFEENGYQGTSQLLFANQQMEIPDLGAIAMPDGSGRSWHDEISSIKVQWVWPKDEVQIPWERVTGGDAKDVGVGANGMVWLVGAGTGPGGNKIYRWNPDSGSWDHTGGHGERIAVEPDGTAWIVQSEGYNGAVWRYAGGGQWTHMGNEARDIGIGAEGSVYIVGTDSGNSGFGIHRWNPDSGSWDHTGEYGLRVAVAPDGNLWIIKNFGSQGHKILYSDDDGNVAMDATKHFLWAEDISVGANGDVWLVGQGFGPGGNKIYRWNPDSASWDFSGGHGISVAVDPEGLPWIVHEERIGGHIWHAVP